ncbi:hypothetical protein B0G52_11861 [Cohnella sp. SGD-V74]|nr:hypothetical protein B0G52_11861 [Cohnella sp. SGD-V74]
MFHYTIKTAKSSQQVITDLSSNLLNENIGVLWKVDLKEKVIEKAWISKENIIFLRSAIRKKQSVF